jgi:glycosyltransferase involved in cell wall biosynthesis
MDGRHPLVSVVVTSHNYAPYVRSAIGSVFDQTYDRIELVVVDDGSTDGSVAVIESFGDRLTAVLTERRGFAAALNRGVATTRGEIVCFLDADDRFLPTKVERVVELLASEPESGAVFHARDIEDLHGVRHAVPLGLSGVLDMRAPLRRGRPPFVATVTSGLAFRRDVLIGVLPLPESIGIGVSDHALKFAALATGPVLFADEVLAVQLDHGDNAYTATHSDAQAADVLLRNALWIDERFPDLPRLRDRLVLEALALTGGSPGEQRVLLDALLSRRSRVGRVVLRTRGEFARGRALLRSSAGAVRRRGPGTGAREDSEVEDPVSETSPDPPNPEAEHVEPVGPV